MKRAASARTRAGCCRSCTAPARRSSPTSSAARGTSRRKWRARCGSSSRPASSPPTASTTCARSSIRAGARDTDRRSRRGLATAPDDGRCSIRPRHPWNRRPRRPPIARRRSKPPAGCCSAGTASSSARSWRARRSCRPGGSCSITFRRLEDRGEVRGGRFISELIGEQFALPVAVDSLRAARKAPPTGEVVTISAADPLNLVGIIVPGERVPAISGRFVTFRMGTSRRRAERAPAAEAWRSVSATVAAYGRRLAQGSLIGPASRRSQRSAFGTRCADLENGRT